MVGLGGQGSLALGQGGVYATARVQVAGRPQALLGLAPSSLNGLSLALYGRSSTSLSASCRSKARKV